MKIYLDNCAFNRPFDDQSQIRIRLEAEAKLYVQEKIKNGLFQLVWSYILDFENLHNPFEERKNAIQKWRKISQNDVNETPTVLKKAEAFLSRGLKPKDALHLACAVEGMAEYFLTTDDIIVRKLAACPDIRAINPIEFLNIIEEVP
jgi:predicted nucleic acid-binding protein